MLRLALDYFTIYPYNGGIVKYNDKLKQLETFDLSTLSELTNLKGKSLYKLAKRRVEDKTFLQLKKGLYTTISFIESNNTLLYKEKIGNILKTPSYLSLEYMLGKYAILSESVYTFTSVSTKKTNTYKNMLGTYSYRNMKKELFKGYFLENDIYYATKAKALFDYLYFKDAVDIESLRLNLDELNLADLNEFEPYCKDSTKMQTFYSKLVEYKRNVS